MHSGLYATTGIEARRKKTHFYVSLIAKHYTWSLSDLKKHNEKRTERGQILTVSAGNRSSVTKLVTVLSPAPSKRDAHTGETEVAPLSYVVAEATAGTECRDAELEF